jgi:cation diffusion facilitator family transporter
VAGSDGAWIAATGASPARGADAARRQIAVKTGQAPLGNPAERLRSAARRGARATALGILSSTILASVKILTGIVGNSYALIADGVESVLDIFSSLLVWGAIRIGTTPQTERFPYGLGKVEPLAALVVATVLLGAAGAIGVAAVHEIATPQQAPAFFTLPVLVAVVITKETMFRTLFATGRSIGSRAIETDAWHHRSDALTSLAAFVGISIAIVGGEGFESADDWAALLACTIIAFNGVRLFRSALNEVLDVAAPMELEQKVRSIAGSVEGVEGIDICRVRKSGLAVLVDIHVEVDGGLSVQDGHSLAHDVKNALLASDLAVLDVLVHIEPAPVHSETV